MAALSIAGIGGAAVLQHELGYRVSPQGISKPSPLGSPPIPPVGEGGFEFTATQPLSGDPVTYSPCDVIHIVVNDRLTPPGAAGLIETAVTEISGHTGLQFAFDGTTDEQPARGAHRRDGGPALIAWSSPEEVPRLAGDVAGLGGSTPQRHEQSGRLRYVSGQVVLDAPQFADILERKNGWQVARAVVLHELGHLVGLDHVDDPSELMSVQNDGVLDFGDGDRRGLALLGSGRCRP